MRMSPVAAIVNRRGSEGWGATVGAGARVGDAVAPEAR